jgi:hypothetical protein
MRRIWWLCLSVSVVSIVATSYLWLVFLTPSEPEVESVAFEAIAADLDSSRVMEIRIRGRTYTYRVLEGEPQRLVFKRATGPEPTLLSVQKLRPTKPDGFPPKIVFEE